MNFSALNVDFDGSSLDFLGLRKPAHEGIKERYPPQGHYFTIVHFTIYLRSAASVTCTVPRTRTRLGDRSFAVAGPRVWNSLPAALRAVEDYEQFKAQLKTHLFD